MIQVLIYMSLVIQHIYQLNLYQQYLLDFLLFEQKFSISVPRIGLIVNDGKPLAVQTADTIQQRLEAAGHAVERASSSGGMVGFANPDQHLRLRGYSACLPNGFEPSIVLANLLEG